MADDKLRSVLIYRIENSDSAVLLANYDFMSDYEAHAGAATEGTLYDGRGKGYSEAVALVVSNDPPTAMGGGLTESIGGFKHQQSDTHQVLYGGDSDGLCIAVVSGLRYPSRVATQMITELYAEYKPTFGEEAKTADAKSLTRKSKPILSKFCKKYAVVQGVDKTAHIQAKVDGVKTKMQDNIAGMLSNMERSESISNQAEELNEQASVFKKNSKTLKRTMRCKNTKMTIILALLITGILLVILVPLISKAVKSGKSDED